MASIARPASANVAPRAVAAAAAPAIHRSSADHLASPDQAFGWDALTLHAAEPNPFFESWYLLPALATLDPGRGVELMRYENGGRLAGLLPLKRAQRYYGHPVPHLGTWLHPNAFLGTPLVAAGDEAGFWRALLTWADAHAGRALFLHLGKLPLSGPLYHALRDVLAEQGRAAALVHREQRALLASPLPASAYFERSVPGKKRKELRRQHARLAELGELRFERSRDGAGLDRWIEEFMALELSGWKGAAASALGSARPTAQLFTQALYGAAECGRLERLTLRLDGRAIAMLVNFLTPPGAFSFKTAYDEAYARFSPGVLIQRENLALLDEPGIAWCDSCAAEGHPMIERIWRERLDLGSLSIAIGGPLRRGLFRLLARAEGGLPIQDL